LSTAPARLRRHFGDDLLARVPATLTDDPAAQLSTVDGLFMPHGIISGLPTVEGHRPTPPLTRSGCSRGSASTAPGMNLVHADIFCTPPGNAWRGLSL
jgi:hypothetical protein